MQFLCMFVFTLPNQKKIRIVSRSMKKALRTFKRLLPNHSNIDMIEIYIRVFSLDEK